MLIPILHFDGNCADAIALYEKTFNTKAEGCDYSDDKKIRHSEMIIHGQKVFLNDNKDFIRNAYGFDSTAHLALTFKTPEELLTCYEKLKIDNDQPFPFMEAPYSKLVGNFVDKIGVLWGFMVADQ